MEPETARRNESAYAIPFLLIATATYFGVSGLSFPVLPRLVDQKLNGGNTEIGLSFAAFGFGLMALRPFVGYLTDRFGRRNAVVGGALLTVISQFLYVPAADIGLWTLLGARFLAGMGGSVMYVGLATIATELPTPERRAAVFGIFASMTFVGFAIGPLVGDIVFESAGFTAAYSTAGAFGLVVLALAWFLPDTTPPDASPNLGKFRELLHPVGARLGIANMTGLLAFIAFNAFVTPWSDELGSGQARWVLFTFGMCALLLRLGSTKILEHPNRTGVLVFTYIAISLSALALATAQGAVLLFAGAVLLALGLAFLTPVLILAAADSSPEAARARVVSTITFFNDFGSSAGVPILGLVADAAGFRGMYLVLIVLAGLTVVYIRSSVLQNLGGFSGEPVTAPS